MLRGVGILLVLVSAAGLLASLLPLLEWFDLGNLIGSVAMFAYSSCGLMSGVLLVRTNSTKRGSLFWLAMVGVVLLLPLFVLHIVTICFSAFTADASILDLVFFPALGGSWWPPKADGFFYLFWGSPGYLEGSVGVMHIIARSWLVWVVLPLAICLWAIWGKRGWADKVFASLALLCALWTAALALEVAVPQYDFRMPYRADTSPAGGTTIDYAYYPDVSWSLYYGTMILWFVAVGILLYGRRDRS